MLAPSLVSQTQNVHIHKNIHLCQNIYNDHSTLILKCALRHLLFATPQAIQLENVDNAQPLIESTVSR